MGSPIPGIVCKIGLTKAYALGTGSFWTVMVWMGFDWRWTRWTRRCVFEFFLSVDQRLRGIRQGDPLPPLLFLLVVEVLGRMVSRANEMGYINGFRVGRDQTMESHLQ